MDKYNLLTVIPTFNSASYVLETLESIANQSVRPDMVIIYDGCSTDNTLEVVKSFTKLPIQIVRTEKNRGFWVDKNFILKYSENAKYLHILDSDDIILPDFYKVMMGHLSAIPGVSIAICISPDKINGQGEVTKSARHQTTRVLTPRQFLQKQCNLPEIYPSFVLFKTEYKQIPIEFSLNLQQIADLLFWGEYSLYCQNGIVEVGQNLLCQYRIHDQSCTSRNKYNVKFWVSDEWVVMNKLLNLYNEKFGGSLLFETKLKCVFSARSHVKINLTDNIDYRDSIKQNTLANVNRLHWLLGYVAVSARDFAFKNRN